MRKKLIVGALLLGSMLSGCGKTDIVNYRCNKHETGPGGGYNLELQKKIGKEDSSVTYYWDDDIYTWDTRKYETLKACEIDGQYLVETR